ncbi:MAG: hypothetical protein QN189_07670 [Armatimonadota bacterium]|nr:hypothetical protein [Armatimonadota bacterium]
MRPVLPEHLLYELARQRHEELLRESARERLGREKGTVQLTLRWRLGEMLVTWGKRLQGEGPPPVISRR